MFQRAVQPVRQQVYKTASNIKAKEDTARQTRLNQQLTDYQKLQEQQYGNLTRSFREYSEGATGRALGGVQQGVALAAQRRGLEGGLAESMRTQAASELYSQGVAAQQSFGSQLAMLQASNLEAFQRGQFEFINQLDMLSVKNNYDEQLMRMQARLIEDAESRQSFFGLAGGIADFFSAGLATKLFPVKQGE